jgi:hypothetical protein
MPVYQNLAMVFRIYRIHPNVQCPPPGSDVSPSNVLACPCVDPLLVLLGRLHVPLLDVLPLSLPSALATAV